MIDTFNWVKDVYLKAYNNAFEWKPLYPNNIISNGLAGIYTDMFFERHGSYTYVKFTIEYVSRCDDAGIIHSEEGTKYFVLHELVLNNVEKKFNIPEPLAHIGGCRDDNSMIVDNYGRYKYVFDDEHTAKRRVADELCNLVVPYVFFLDDSKRQELAGLLGDLKKDTKSPITNLFDAGISMFKTLDSL